MNIPIIISDVKEQFLKSLEGLTLELKTENGTKLTVNGLFDCVRIAPGKYPDDYHHYAIRHSYNDDSIAVELKQSVLVNHYGDFLCKENLDTLLKQSKDSLKITDWNHYSLN